MFKDLLSVLYIYVRPLLKWFLHRFTNLCELQRICYGAHKGARRTKLVQRSLAMSRKPQIKHLVYCLDEITSTPFDESLIQTEIVDRAVSKVLMVKRINPKYHPGFSKSFGQCVEQIYGFKRLVAMIEQLRTTQFSSDNEEHERKLLSLWSHLVPDTPLESRITKQWQEIGFQGDDPGTDFRGMGILGLENLLYFATAYPGTCRHVLSHSHHPSFGYTFAVVGINITSMAVQLMQSEPVQTHFYNTFKKYPTMESFHQLYCYLFYEFDGLWMLSKPESIMEFSFIQEKFERKIQKALSNDDCNLKMNLSVEVV